MLLLSIWITFAGWIADFDLGYQGAVLTMPSFGRAFGQCQQVADPASGVAVEHCALSALQSSLTNLSMPSFVVGASLVGVLGTWFGRRQTIQTACMSGASSTTWSASVLVVLV